MKETKRKGFNFYRSYYDVFNELNPKDKLSFITALLERQFLGREPQNLGGMANFAYLSQKFNIDAQVKGFESKTNTQLIDNEPYTPPTQGAVEGASVQEKEKEKEKEQYVTQKRFYAKELEKSSEKEKYQKFIDILFGKNDLEIPLDRVLGLKDQVTAEQFSKLLLKKSDKKTFTFILQNLENTTKYTSGKKSLYMILLNWLKTDF